MCDTSTASSRFRLLLPNWFFFFGVQSEFGIRDGGGFNARRTKRPPEQGSAPPASVGPKQKKRSEPPSELRQTRSAVLTVALDPPPLEAFPLVATQPRGLAKDFDAVDEKERPSKGPRPFWPKWPLKWATTRPEKAAARLFLPQCAPHTTPGGWAPVWGRSGDYSGKSLFHAGGLGGPATK